jgi:hypothetical protein
MVVLPVISIGAEHFFFRSSAPLLFLVGKWFVFWGAGVRLFLAGLKQFFQPRFTAEKIFGITGDDPLPFVRELGVANFATGTVGILSLLRPTFVLPVAITGAVFYGIAGIRHATDKNRNPNQNLAMITDLLVSVVFVAYIGFQTFA